MLLNRSCFIILFGSLFFTCLAFAQSRPPTSALPEVDVTAKFIPTTQYCPRIIENPSIPESIRSACVTFLRNQSGADRNILSVRANPYAQNPPGSTTNGAAGGGGSSQTSQYQQQTSNDGNSAEQEQRQAQQYEQEQQQQYECSRAQSIAYQNCVNPSVNVGGGSQESVAQVLEQALGATAQSSGGISVLCDQMKHASRVATALDTYLANQCHLAISQCASVCSGIAGSTACSRLTTVESTMVTQADEAQLNVKIASNCQTKTQTAQASTARANGPGTNGASGGIAMAYNGNSSGASNNPFNNSLTINVDNQQLPQIRNIYPAHARLSQTRTGGGASPLGNGLKNANRSANANFGRSLQTQKGWNTHIMLGLASGGGYSPSRGGVTGQTTNANKNWGSNDSPGTQPGEQFGPDPAMNQNKYLPIGDESFNDVIEGRGPASMPGNDNAGIFQTISSYACSRGFIMSKSCITELQGYSEAQLRVFRRRQTQVLTEICIVAFTIAAASAYFLTRKKHLVFSDDDTQF